MPYSQIGEVESRITSGAGRRIRRGGSCFIMNGSFAADGTLLTVDGGFTLRKRLLKI